MIIIKGYRKEKSFLDDEKPIEKQLSLILAYLEIMAEKDKKERIKWEESRRQYEAEQKRLQELKAYKEQEIKRFNNLLHEVNRYHQSKLLREYINDKEKQAIQHGLLSDDLKNWISWARQKADGYDPLIEKEDEILEDYLKKAF